MSDVPTKKPPKTPPPEPPFGRTPIHEPKKNTRWAVNDSKGLAVKIDTPLTYLAWHASTKRFYVAPDEPRQYLGNDLSLAIFRFYEIARKKLNQTGLIGMDIVWANEEAIRQRFGHDVASVELKTKEQWEEIYRAKYRKLLLENPHQAAREFAIPELANLAVLPKSEPSLTVTKLWHAYKHQTNPPRKEWMNTTRTYWREFIGIVRVRRISEINAEKLTDYSKVIMSEGFAAGTIKNTFGQIKAVINAASSLGKDITDLDRVLKLVRGMLVPPKNDSDIEPQPIDPKDFKKLLAASDVRQKAIFMLSLNAMFHRSEIAAVETRHIDWTKKTLSMKRNKTSCRRSAVLWDDTIKAIKAYQKIDPHKNPFLILNSRGAPFTRNSIGKNFRTVAKKAGLPDTIQFGHIRDGGYTAAITGGLTVDQARILAGHKLAGVSDDYIKRNPKMVAKACKSIAKEYGYK